MSEELGMNALTLREARLMLKHYAVRLVRCQVLIYRIRRVSAAGDVSAQKYEAIPKSGGSHSDPVSRHYHKLEKLRTALEYAINDVQPVMDEYHNLKNSSIEEEREMFLILERHYKDHESIEEIAEDLGRSARTLYRRKLELIQRVAKGIWRRRAEKWQ